MEYPLPQDPNLLLGVVNMKLRDYYSSIEALCEDLNITPADIIIPLEHAGFHYDAHSNQFHKKMTGNP